MSDTMKLNELYQNNSSAINAAFKLEQELLYDGQNAFAEKANTVRESLHRQHTLLRNLLKSDGEAEPEAPNFNIEDCELLSEKLQSAALTLSIALGGGFANEVFAGAADMLHEGLSELTDMLKNLQTEEKYNV